MSDLVIIFYYDLTSNMSHPEFLGLDYSPRFYQKSGRKTFFDRFFDTTMLDMNGMRLEYKFLHNHSLAKSLNLV